MSAPLRISIAVAWALALAISAHAQSPTIFTYQGRLTNGAAPANGVHVMEFSLWDAPAAGALIAGPIVQNGVVVTNGLFTTQIDFGVNAFNNAPRWLAIEVNGIGLTPRQFISRTPYSITTRGLFVDGNMRAGIGTNAPSAETTLHVRDNTNDNFGVLVDSLGTPGSQIGLHTSATTYASLAKNAFFNGAWQRFSTAHGAFLQETDPTGNVRFATAPAGANPITFNYPLFLGADGKVGIGMQFALAALDIGTIEQNADLSLFSFNNGPDDRARIFLQTFERSWWIENDGFLNLFKIRDNTAGADRLVINTFGDVGINTQSPRTNLHVQRGSAGAISPYGNAPLAVEGSTHTYINLLSPANTERGILFGQPGTLGSTAGGIVYNSPGTPDGFQFRANGNDTKMIIEDDGSVGINTLAPGFFWLSVNGSAAKLGGGEWSVFSDARLKKNIHDLDGALERLLRLRGRTFEFIDPAAHLGLPGEQIGLIAQEVEPVFPKWIDEDEDGTKILTIRGFEALTIEALREMRAERDAMIEAQADRIAALERDNAALSERLARLEQALDARRPR